MRCKPLPVRLAAPCPVICGLARATRGDIEARADAVALAARQRIHTWPPATFTWSTSCARAAPRCCRSFQRWWPMPAPWWKTWSFLRGRRAQRSRVHVQVIEAAIALGHYTINTGHGYATPAEFGALIAGIDANVPNISQAVISMATTTWAWPWPTSWKLSKMVHGSSSAPLMASVSVPAMPAGRACDGAACAP